jgi:5-methylcytosine-specific restriction endonuclease McrA
VSEVKKHIVIFKGKGGSIQLEDDIFQKLLKNQKIKRMKYLQGMYVSLIAKEDMEQYIGANENLAPTELENAMNETKTGKRVCVLCQTEKKAKKFKGEDGICNQCKSQKESEGYFIVKNIDREIIGKISINRATHLLKMKKAYRLTKKLIAVFDEQILEYIKGTNYSDDIFILVALSGKWSMEINKKELDELVEDKTVEHIKDNIYRRTISIQKLKEDTLKRDKNTCHYCQKEGDGVIFGKIPMLSNSITTCLPCERERKDGFLLKWLGIKEAKTNIFGIEATNIVWIKDKDSDKEYPIYQKDADQLIRGKMAKQISGNKIQVLFTRFEFKQMILQKYENTCYYCGKEGKTIDHIIPKSKGGITTKDNCVCSCLKCNEDKGNMSVELFMEEEKFDV